MISTAQQIINHVVIGVLAVIVLGGSLALLLLGRDVPAWWQNFDGMVIIAAFANGQSFIQARQGLPVATALSSALTSLGQAAGVGSAASATSTPQTTQTTTGSK